MVEQSSGDAIDVVIVAYNSATRLRSLLPTLVGERGIGKVVVVDHGVDGSADVAEAAGARVVLDPSNPGFGAGQNNGRTMTDANFVLVLNPDLTIDAHAVVRALSHFDDRMVAGVQGVIRNGTTGLPERSAGRLVRPVHLWGRLMHARGLLKFKPIRWLAARSSLLVDHVNRVPSEPHQVEALGATATLYRAQALSEVGGFDERIFMYGEDQELCARLGEQGWRLLAVPDEWAVHASGESTPDTWERERVYWNGVLSFGALRWSTASWLAGFAAGLVRSVRAHRTATAQDWLSRQKSGVRSDPSPACPMSTLRCRFCGTLLRLTFVDLGSTPLANSYVEPARAAEADPIYPLHARVCESCFLVQVEAVVAPAEIFDDYAYFSSVSDSWLDHARRFAHQATSEQGLHDASLVLEIASNDGYLLRHFAGLGVPTLGVEPARNVAEAALELGIETVVDFFGTSLAEQLVSDGRQADLVVANNVLAHVPDLNDFVEGIRIVLKAGGAVSIEVPHLLRLIEQVAFDTIYHEHFSYFSLFTIERVLAAHELVVFDVEELPTHGGSLRVWATHRSDSPPTSARVEQVRAAEQVARLATADAYGSFSASVERCRDGFLTFLADTATGRGVAAYGAAAKGNTFLNYCGVTVDDIPYVVDRSPHKQGLLLPGSHLPIHSPDHVAETQPQFLVILPWNLRDEIAEQMGAIRGWAGQFVVAVPSVEIF